MKKSDIEKLLRSGDYGSLKTLFSEHPGSMRKLMGFLYHPDKALRDAAAKGYGVVAEVMPLDKLKDLIRRMVWMLNDESGSCCWHVPQALGEIGYNNPDAIADFVGCISYYENDPDETLSSGITYFMKRIAETGRNFEESQGYVVSSKRNK